MITLYFHLLPEYKYELEWQFVFDTNLFNVWNDLNNLERRFDRTTSAFIGFFKSQLSDGYRKPTHTDKYLDYNSHNPSQHKRSVVN